jgi:hypothetical protein
VSPEGAGAVLCGEVDAAGVDERCGHWASA